MFAHFGGRESMSPFSVTDRHLTVLQFLCGRVYWKEKITLAELQTELIENCLTEVSLSTIARTLQQWGYTKVHFLSLFLLLSTLMDLGYRSHRTLLSGTTKTRKSF